MAATPNLPTPRYRPAVTGYRARRVVVALGVLAVTAIGTATWLHSTSFSLRCEDGTLHAYRSGLIPWERVPLDDPALPPLTVAPHLCQDVVVDSSEALISAYASIVTRDVDHALETEDNSELGTAERALDTLVNLQATEDPEVAARRRSLVVAQLRADLATARAARLRAQQRLRRARELGVKPALLSAFERELGELDQPVADIDSDSPPSRTEPSPSAPPATPPGQDPKRPGRNL